jgi:hypothetical protein
MERVPPVSGTPIWWPHAPQETRPCQRAVPGRGLPRVGFRSDAACWSVSLVGLGRDVAQLRDGGETSGRPRRPGSWGSRVLAGRACGAARRRVRLRPEVHAPAEAGGLRRASPAATRGACHPRAPKRSRRGSNRSWGWHPSPPFLAERHGKKVSHTNDRRAWASWVGLVCPGPWPLRTQPVGRCQATAPRAALGMRPAVRRAGLGCRSHADSVPCQPTRRRPLPVAGSSLPSPSAITPPWSPPRAQSGYPSEP